MYVLGAALLRAGRLDEAVRRFEESLAVQPDWPNSGMNAYGLALAHHRLGHPEEARRWLERAEAWLGRLDRAYAGEAPGDLSGQPKVSVPFEHWVYAQVLRREAAGPILDASFPANPFAYRTTTQGRIAEEAGTRGPAGEPAPATIRGR
jgi:tetratricopeptide (TPR) repeat protein